MKKVLSLLFLTIILCVFFTLNTFAYLDPTVVTYVVQAVAGVVIAGSAVFVLLWARAKRKIAKKLNIDENKNKEVEEDIVVNEDVKEDEQKADVPEEEKDAN